MYLFIFLSFKEEIILSLIEYIASYLESFYTLSSISIESKNKMVYLFSNVCLDNFGAVAIGQRQQGGFQRPAASIAEGIQ